MFPEKYFEMNKKQCREGLDLYKKFLIRMDKVAEFLKVAEVSRSELTPDLYFRWRCLSTHDLPSWPMRFTHALSFNSNPNLSLTAGARSCTNVLY